MSTRGNKMRQNGRNINDDTVTFRAVIDHVFVATDEGANFKSFALTEHMRGSLYVTKKKRPKFTTFELSFKFNKVSHQRDAPHLLRQLWSVVTTEVHGGTTRGPRITSRAQTADGFTFSTVPVGLLNTKTHRALKSVTFSADVTVLKSMEPFASRSDVFPKDSLPRARVTFWSAYTSSNLAGDFLTSVDDDFLTPIVCHREPKHVLIDCAQCCDEESSSVYVPYSRELPLRQALSLLAKTDLHEELLLYLLQKQTKKLRLDCATDQPSGVLVFPCAVRLGNTTEHSTNDDPRFAGPPGTEASFRRALRSRLWAYYAFAVHGADHWSLCLLHTQTGDRFVMESAARDISDGDDASHSTSRHERADAACKQHLKHFLTDEHSEISKALTKTGRMYNIQVPQQQHGSRDRGICIAVFFKVAVEALQRASAEPEDATTSPHDVFERAFRPYFSGKKFQTTVETYRRSQQMWVEKSAQTRIFPVPRSACNTLLQDENALASLRSAVSDAYRKDAAAIAKQLLRRWYGYALDVTQMSLEQLLRMHRESTWTTIQGLTNMTHEIKKSFEAHALQERGDIRGPTNMLVCGRGWTPMLESLKKLAGGEAGHIQLGEPVLAIDARSEDIVRIQTTKQKEYQARYAIATFPIGVMRASVVRSKEAYPAKQNKGIVSFNPPLEKERIDAILSTLIGFHEKVGMAYSSPYWGRKAMRKGEVGYNIRAEEDGGRRFLATLDGRWTSITNMAVFERFDDTCSRLCIVYRHVFPLVSTALNTWHVEQFDGHMRALFGCEKSKTESDETAPKVVMPWKTSTWRTDPYTMLMQHCALYRNGGRVFFAGEHMSDDYGNVAGAYDSGVSRAQKVLKRISSDRTDNNCEDGMYDIVVVGAGVTSLAATGILRNSGQNLNVLVLEAQNQIGGRVHSVKIDEHISMEMGASYIMGYEHPVVQGHADAIPRTLNEAVFSSCTVAAPIDTGYWEPTMKKQRQGVEDDAGGGSDEVSGRSIIRRQILKFEKVDFSFAQTYSISVAVVQERVMASDPPPSKRRRVDDYDVPSPIGASKAETSHVAHVAQFLFENGLLEQGVTTRSLAKHLTEGKARCKTDAFFKLTNGTEMLFEYDPGYTHGDSEVGRDQRKTTKLRKMFPDAFVVRLRVGAALFEQLPQWGDNVLVVVTESKSPNVAASAAVTAVAQRIHRSGFTATKACASSNHDTAAANAAAADLWARMSKEMEAAEQRVAALVGGDLDLARKLMATGGVPSRVLTGAFEKSIKGLQDPKFGITNLGTFVCSGVAAQFDDPEKLFDILTVLKTRFGIKSLQTFVSNSVAARFDDPPALYAVLDTLRTRFGIKSLQTFVSGGVAARFDDPPALYAVLDTLRTRFGIKSLQTFVSDSVAARFDDPPALYAVLDTLRTRFGIKSLQTFVSDGVAARFDDPPALYAVLDTLRTRFGIK
eukprot:g118.t1